jgi:hypothetical protein
MGAGDAAPSQSFARLQKSLPRLALLPQNLPSGSIVSKLVERKPVIAAEVQQHEKDEEIQQLLARHIPLLIGGSTSGEHHHEERSADQSKAGKDAEDQSQSKGSLREWDDVTKSEYQVMRQRSIRKTLCGISSKGSDAGVDPNESMTRKIDTECDAKQSVR